MNVRLGTGFGRVWLIKSSQQKKKEDSITYLNSGPERSPQKILRQISGGPSSSVGSLGLLDVFGKYFYFVTILSHVSGKRDT